MKITTQELKKRGYRFVIYDDDDFFQEVRELGIDGYYQKEYDCYALISHEVSQDYEGDISLIDEDETLSFTTIDDLNRFEKFDNWVKTKKI